MKHGIFISLMPCVDLYGRGYSDAPETTYDSTLYTTQLALLMQYLKWDKANIVGLSMGGGIAAAFTSQFPHLVDEGVGLIASAGLMEVSAFFSFFASGLVILTLLLALSQTSFRALQNLCRHLLY